MYKNGEMRSVETLSGMGEGEIKENYGGGELKCDIFICCKHFFKCHNVPLAQQ
jgi:hypothetical protein